MTRIATLLAAIPLSKLCAAAGAFEKVTFESLDADLAGGKSTTIPATVTAHIGTHPAARDDALKRVPIFLRAARAVTPDISMRAPRGTRFRGVLPRPCALSGYPT